VQDFNFGVVPQHCADVDDAYVRLRSAGAVILTNAGTSRDDARALAQRILAPLSPIVPDPAPIKVGGGNRDRSYITSRLNESFAVTFQSGHTDGFAYGDRYPDYIFLLCVKPAAVGGESFVVDTDGILETLRASDSVEDAAFVNFLRSVPVEQTEPGFVPSFAPVVGNNGRGRQMSRWTPVQRPHATLPQPEHERQRAWLARWTELAHRASLSAPRFVLQAGEAICLDNYRMLHGRTGFDDLERTLWLIWAWTTESLGVPDGLLFSDSRYAVVE
jgi:alpha-ketoglutarate-dependent taurine dioxygenase